MSRNRSSLIVLALVVMAVVAFGSGISRASTVTCPRVTFPPVLDGALDDWPPLPQIVIADPGDWHAASPQYDEYGGPDDISAAVRLAWDSQALYLAIETSDNRIVRVRSAAEIDRGDSIVLALRGEDSSETNQFVVALLSTRSSLVWRAEPAQLAGEVRTVGRALAIRAEEEGARKLVYELSIPWSELKEIRPLPGAGLTLTVSACDDDGAGLKGCLERTTTVKLSTKGIGPLAADQARAPVPGIIPVFPAPDLVRFDEKCFTLNRSDAFLFGGEFEYWLLPEASWIDRLNAAKAAGLNVVAVTVPWSHFQPSRTPPDLGEVRRFLTLCKSAGLLVQLSIGPFADDRLPAGGAPGWVLSLPSAEDRAKAVREWLQALWPVASEYQITQGGPIVSVVVRPLPGAIGDVTPAAIEQVLTAFRSSHIAVPLLTANAPAARGAAPQAMASVLDTLSFYEPVDAATLAAQVQALGRDEIGPAVITALPGDYGQPNQARRSADLVRGALASGAAGVTLSDFAPGFDPAVPRKPGSDINGIVDPAGAQTPGYGEVRLLGTFVRQFGPAVLRSMTAEGVVETDDPEVRAVVRYGKQQSFLFLWDEKGKRSHQVRLSYLLPDRDTRISVPEAGAIQLPPGGAKIMLLDTPFGRGTLRYCTSDVLALHQLGDRWLLVVYGDVDTPGEIAIRLPGPPLVTGDVARQTWNAADKTIILDYYHGEKDRYLLADELEIAVLSRDRAAASALALGGAQGVTLIAGASVADASLDSERLTAAVDCRPGTVEMTAALPKQPTAVTVDGASTPFEFKSPERVVTFQVTTSSLSDEQRPKSALDRLGRAIAGGPPYPYARFDTALFMADADAPRGDCPTHDRVAAAPETLGLAPGALAGLRTHFTADGAAELVIAGSSYPLLVSVNGRLVDALSGFGPERRADVSSLTRSGSNDLEIIAEIEPRGIGLSGLRDTEVNLPEARLVTPSGEVVLSQWEVCPSLAGERAGYMGSDVDERRWRFTKLGAWREQGRALANVQGVGWYRMGFKLPRAAGWNIPYYINLDLRGASKVYFDGRAVASTRGGGAYRLPIPSSLAGPDNVLALAVYGAAEDTGLYAAQVSADDAHITRRRNVEIRF